jgi:tetratricopeptide (TPR) repeat protein
VICTFYSFKGGVGRSMAAANVGEWMYLHGLRVVLVDWDLEAPGLEAFFPSDEHQGASPDRQPGLMDLLLDYKEDLPFLTLPSDDPKPAVVAEALAGQLPGIRGHLYPLHPPVSAGGGESALWLLPAGRRDGPAFDGYAEAVQRFDWADFYSRFRGEAFYEWLRRQLLDEDLADVVLIDTRTGISEMGGVATRQLADVVVSFCVPNRQNIEGVMKLTKSFTRDDVIEARGRGLDLLVVPTRIENSEIDARNWAKRQFGLSMEHLRPEAMASAGRDFWDLRIPYVPKYAYRETLAVGAPDSAEELVDAYEKLAWELLSFAPEGSRARALADGNAAVRRPEPVALPTVSNIPARIPLVVGRQRLLSEMRSRLTGAGIPLVLCGLNGVGKSAVAIEYAHRFQPDYDVMWWIDASSEGAIADGYMTLAREVGAYDTDAPITAARRWLASHLRWLLVLDGADDPEATRQHVPSEKSGHVVITSHNPNWGSVATPLEVPALERSDSVELLHRLTGDVDADAAAHLAEYLGDLPLALEQASAYMEATGRSNARYISLLENEGARVLSSTKQTPATASVVDALERSYRELADYPAARDLLALCSMLAPGEVPLDLLADGPRLKDPPVAFLWDPLALDEAVVGLRRFSFATRRGDAIRVNPLLQALVRGWLRQREARARAGLAVKVVLGALGAASDAGRLLPHAHAAADHAIEVDAAPVEVVELLVATGELERASGQADAAAATIRRASERAVKRLPADHPALDALVRAQVSLLVEQGDLEAAAAALQRELPRVRAAGPAAAEVRILGDLGVVRLRQRNVHAGEVLNDAFGKALKLNDRADVAWLLVNLGVARTQRGEHAAAETLFSQAVDRGAAASVIEHAKAASGSLHEEFHAPR